MRMLQSKKGFDYAAMMVLVVLVCVIYLFLQLQTKLGDFNVRIGESQVALLNTYQEREHVLMYVDQVGQYAAHKAVYELAAHGGFVKSPCGTAKGYQRWNNPSKPDQFCFPNVYDNYKEHLTNALNYYLEKHPTPLPRDNYKYLVENTTVHAIAIAPVELFVQPPPEKRPFYVAWFHVATDVWQKAAIGRVTFKPSFSASVRTELDRYAPLQTMTQELTHCNGNLTCIESKVPSPLTMKALGDDVYAFELPVPSAKSPFEQDPPTIQFALTLPKSI